MKIYIDNIKENIACKVAVCGEIDKDCLLARAPASKSGVWKAIRELARQKVIKEHKYDDKRTFLRLSSVNSKEYLGSISPALVSQAMSVVNTDIKYSGSKDARMRERASYELYHEIERLGIPINGICFEQRGNCFGVNSNSRKTEGASIFKGPDIEPCAEDAARHISSPEQNEFFTKKIIKKESEEEKQNKEGRRRARFAGVLLVNAKAFFVYSITDIERMAWRNQAEFDGANYFCGVLERESPYIKETGTRVDPNCILYFHDTEQAKKMLCADQDSKISVYPYKTYKKSHVVPQAEILSAYIPLLGIDEWENKMIRVFFPEAKESEAADAVLPDGTEIYNFAGCDLNRIKYATARIMGLSNHVIILAPEWAVESLRKIYPREGVDYMQLSPEDLKVIAAAIK